MQEIFINYRTGDGEKTAALIDQELVRRFGREHVFRASRSIPPGRTFPEALLRGLRGSCVLLAVIGPSWTDAQHQLRDSHDWVRREIEEAFACALPVVPVLDGRRMDRLRKEQLPPELSELADIQSIAFDTADPEPGLRRIVEVVTDFAPGLKDLTCVETPSPVSESVRNSIGEVSGTAVQARDFTGDVGNTVIKDVRGSAIHTGTGDIHHTSRHVSGDRHFSGNGMTYFEGDNHGGVHHQFPQAASREDEQQ